MKDKRIVSTQTINIVALSIASKIAVFGQQDREIILSKVAEILRVVSHLR